LIFRDDSIDDVVMCASLFDLRMEEKKVFDIERKGIDFVTRILKGCVERWQMVIHNFAHCCYH